MASFRSRLFLRIVSNNREIYTLKAITLAIAFASSTLIALFALHEFGYDQFHEKPNQIVRILQRDVRENAHGNRLSARIPDDVFQSLNYSPDSLVVARVRIMNGMTASTSLIARDEVRIHAADSAITAIFTFIPVNGALKDFRKIGTVILSQRAAVQYFGSPSASGKQIAFHSFTDTIEFTVAAVFKDFPQNTHDAFDIVIHYDTGSIQRLGFDPRDAGVYGRMNKGSRINQELVIRRLVNNKEFEYKLQTLPEIYFGPSVRGEEARHGDSYSIMILICITGLILCLALTSFINLTTLTLPRRAKELAVKKLAGTSQGNLLLMFARESFLVTGISLFLGVALLLATANFIEPILSIDVIDLFLHQVQVIGAILFVLFFLTGLAPLFLTIRFARATPIRLMSTDAITFPRLKKIIGIVQLGAGLFLIVSSMVIRRQVNYSLIKEPGRNHYQIVYLNYPRGLTDNELVAMQQTWSKGEGNPHIDGAIALSQLPNEINSRELNANLYSLAVDPYFPTFFDLKLQEGRWFLANDGDSLFVVNRKGLEALHGNTKNVIGVLEDLSNLFNQPEKPVKISRVPYYRYNFLCIRILEVDIRGTVNLLADMFGSEGSPAKISFVNKQFEEWLAYQDKLNVLSEIMTLLSGLLACCAIYGLSLSVVRDKIKQIAIHKLCGASTVNITQLLMRDFARQVIIALLIFGPFTFIFLTEWLRNFVFSTHFAWSDPVIPLVYCSIVITLLCAWQAYNLNRSDLSSSLKG